MLIFPIVLPPVPTNPLTTFATNLLTISTLLIVGFFIENYYVSRLTVFSNGVALVTFINSAQRLDWFLIVYGAIGLVAGIIGLVYYLRQIELPVEYYEVVFYTFSSAPVGIFIALSILFSPSWIWLPPSFLVGSLINSKILLSLKNKTVPVEELPLAIPVTQWYLNKYYGFRSSL